MARFASTLLRTLSPLFLVTVAACSADVEDDGSSDDAVTSVGNTSVKEQLHGTCWLYATAAWAESLHLQATGKAVNLSESYWFYWALYDRITGGKVEAGGWVKETGSWGDAVEIISRYGMMTEGDFIPEEANDPSSERIEDALNDILFSLSNGKLTTPASRRDRALVRSELNRVFRLRPQAVAWMDASFGKDGTKVLNKTGGAVAGGARIMSAKDFVVFGGKGAPNRTLEDFVGVDNPNIDPNVRMGTSAWKVVSYPRGTDARAKRATLKRIQGALNAGLPVLISWRADKAAVKPDGSLRAPSAKRAETEAHLSIITDYQVSNVPGFGVLPVGKREERPQALQASEADTSVVDLLRIKNSWGASPRQNSAIPPGYYDIYRGYYDASYEICDGGSCLSTPAFNYVILPAGY